ncbi:transgelin-like [Ciona intestinalis]
MANRPKGYGNSAEVASKIDAKYSEEDELEIVAWISSLVQSSPAEKGKEAFQAWLKDGQVLCKLMNALQVGSCKPNPPYTGKAPAIKQMKEMANLGMFLNAANEYGVKHEYQFQTVDLYEAENLARVQIGLIELGRCATKKGAPGLVPKEETENKRDSKPVTEGSSAGGSVIGLQMGTNKGPSQSGQNFGMERKIRD